MRSVLGLRRIIAAIVAGAAWLAIASSDSAGQQEKRWTIIAVPESVIGEALGDEEYQFQSIAFARFLPDGRIVVADRGLLEVRIYSRDGKFQKRIGRRGEGPGEFHQIDGMWLTTGGLIAVWDAKNRRVTTLDLSLQVQNTKRIIGHPEGGSLEGFLGAFRNDEIVLGSAFFRKRTPEATPDRWEVGLFGTDGKFKSEMGEVRGMWRFNRYAIPFSPMPYSIVHRDSLYVADGFEGEVTVRDRRGAIKRTIRLPLIREIDADVVWSALEAEVRKRKQASKSPFFLVILEYIEYERVPRTKKFPQIGGLMVDDQGNLWVKSYDPIEDTIWLRAHPLWPGAGGGWRVVRSDGSRVATVSMPENVRPLDVRGNRVLGVAIDEYDVQQLVVHSIQR